MAMAGAPGVPGPQEGGQVIPGYENVTNNPAFLTPPVMVLPTAPPPDRETISNFPTLTDEQVKEAVLEFASEHCCYGKKPAKELTVTDIKMSSCFHYKLETFGEQRQTCWVSAPYRVGEYVDGPQNGVAPGAWDLNIPIPGMFKDSKGKTDVPHTAYVTPCTQCVGIGRVRCTSCQGNGRSDCSFCFGRGYKDSFGERESCTSCNGSGHRRCTWCTGSGQTQCTTCHGHCQLKFNVLLTINWKNHVEDYISDTTVIPKENIRQATGQVAFDEQQPLVYPVNHFPDQAVNDASGILVNKHSKSFPMERILQQKHQVRIIPVAQVHYSWNGKMGQFCVYGFENRVYFPDYPQKCCCTII